ncbi:MAG: UDP-N-acetylmuramate--L-alanine ligase [Clostridia bacterium]|nr:UDP-N-acetylmuramate--L-alanine ligase [Clostridia bacterium]
MQARVVDYKGKRIHFIGIGGSSMSGLAGLMLEKGYIVTGTDRTKSHKTEALEAKGIKIYIGHEPENVHGADIIVYSAAIAATDCERAEAFKLNIPQLERCDLLGQLMEDSKFAIGVSGTHGKTTTTAMLAQVFMALETDPTIHIGGELDFIGGSTRTGSGEDFIFEACEFNNSFLKFHPTIAIIQNIDEDHLEFFGNIDNIEKAFAKYAALVPAEGCIVGWGDDFRVKRVMENSGKPFVSYGLSDENDYVAKSLSYDARGRAVYDLYHGDEKLCHVEMGVAGEANMLDSLAALSVAHLRGLNMQKAADALSSFIGAHRRNELTGTVDGVDLYTDYGHNPAEIKSALGIAKLIPHNELWAVWQPHTYSRTKMLFDGFVETFDGVDHVLITDIMAARETDPGDIKSEMLIEPIRARGIDAVHTPTFDDAEAYLRAHWHAGDIMISHGCGNIDLLNEQIAAHGDTKR